MEMFNKGELNVIFYIISYVMFWSNWLVYRKKKNEGFRLFECQYLFG